MEWAPYGAMSGRGRRAGLFLHPSASSGNAVASESGEKPAIHLRAIPTHEPIRQRRMPMRAKIVQVVAAVRVKLPGIGDGVEIDVQRASGQRNTKFPLQGRYGPSKLRRVLIGPGLLRVDDPYSGLPSQT